MRIKLLFTLLLLSLNNIAHAQTQIGDDIDGETVGDYLGGSVSLNSSGNVIAIGAFQNDGINGSASGHVRVYENISGTWTQIGGDIDGENPNDLSGVTCLNSDGSIIAIGASENQGNGTDSGHVRVYENLGGTWTQIGVDIDGEVNENFGWSVSLNSDGDVLAIGAIAKFGMSGLVRIYENSGGVWTQLGLDIDGEAADDQFGRSVSLSNDGSIVAIGAGLNDDNGYNSGHVRVYENISGTWTQIGADIDGEFVGDQSGHSIDLSSDGSIVAIGAYKNSGNGTDSGHVRVYENLGGTWTQIGADINGESTEDRFGISLKLSSDGTIIVIGADRNDGNGNGSGHTRIYQNIADTWTQVGSDIDGEATGDGSGYSVSLSADGSIVAIGAQYNDGNGNLSGHVRVYDLTTVLSLEDNTFSSNFSVYPNPSNGLSKIQLGENYNEVSVNVFNVLGKQVYSQKHYNINEIELNTQDYATGVSFIKVQSGAKEATIKLVVN